MAEYDTKKETIYVDTNVVFESHRLRIWNAIRKSYKLGTVEKVIEECIRKPSKQNGLKLGIDEDELRNSFYVINRATRAHRASLAVKCNIDLDDGEKYLIAYLLAQTKNFYFCCTADYAAIRAGVELDLNHSFVSLEKLACDIGLRKNFAPQFTERILSIKKTEYLIEKKA